MVLQSSGAISLGDIATEFGGTQPHSLSEYYGAPGLPANGTISIPNFYGKSSQQVTTENGLTWSFGGRGVARNPPPFWYAYQDLWNGNVPNASKIDLSTFSNFYTQDSQYGPSYQVLFVTINGTNYQIANGQAGTLYFSYYGRQAWDLPVVGTLTKIYIRIQSHSGSYIVLGGAGASTFTITSSFRVQ